MKRGIAQLTTALLIFSICSFLSAQTNSSTYVSCTSGGCVTSSNITLNGVQPGVNPGDPASIQAGDILEVCYEVTGWNYININWFHGAQPHVSAGLVAPDASSNVSSSGGNQNWIWASYCTVNCCSAMQCSPPATGDWLFGVDSDQVVCPSGAPNDGELSNNWGDSSSGPWEFCIDIETECGAITNGVISSDISWGVYSDKDMGSAGVSIDGGCGCEGGAIECSIDVDVICCDVPDLLGDGPSGSTIFTSGGSCVDEVTSLFVTGDIANPDYLYEWNGPSGSGPNAAVWDANASVPLPMPPPAGMYTLSVTNTASGNCEKIFAGELFQGGDASIGSATSCIGFGDSFVIQATGEAIGGPACALTGVGCLAADDPLNPYNNPVVVVNPNQLSPESIGLFDIVVTVGQSGSPCFSLASGQLEILPAVYVPVDVQPSFWEGCYNYSIEDQLTTNFNVTNPQSGVNYEWTFSETYSPDAVFATGTSADVAAELDQGGGGSGDIGDITQPVYVFPITSDGCVGNPEEIVLSFENCECLDAGTLIEASGLVSLCSEDIGNLSGVLNNLDQLTLEDPNGQNLSYDLGSWVSPTPAQNVYLQVDFNGFPFYQDGTPSSITSMSGLSLIADFDDLAIAITDGDQDPCETYETNLTFSLWCVVDGIDEVSGPFDAGSIDLGIEYDCQQSDPSCNASFQGNVSFEGYYGSGAMSTDLSDNNLLPTSQPFANSTFNYNGNESFVNPPPLTVDWILVELRDANNESLVLDRRAALVNDDGDIMDTDGNLGISFDSNNTGSYFVVIHHLGHVSIMSDSPLTLPLSSVFAFDSSNVKNGSVQMKTVDNKDVMISGDYDNNNTVNFSDFILWLDNNNALNTYASFDADGNGTINFFDFILWLVNNNHLAYSGI